MSDSPRRPLPAALLVGLIVGLGGSILVAIAGIASEKGYAPARWSLFDLGCSGCAGSTSSIPNHRA